MSAEKHNGADAASHWQQLERKESELWRYSLLLLVLLAAALAASTWGPLRELNQHRLEALPIGILVLIALFGVYVWRRQLEIVKLRGIIRGLEQSATAPPTEKQVDQLLDYLSRSQHGYRDLIDSFDHLLFTLSLQGEIKLMNRRFAETIGLSYDEVAGHRLDEFVAEPTRAEAERALAQFIEQRYWSGVVRTRLKTTGEVRHFDCALHAVVKDEQVIGVSGLARDITARREPEARLAQLFETLQEGVYLSTPEGRILDANPAMVRMLGYGSREELLAVSAYDLYFDPGERDRLREQAERADTLRDLEITLRRKDGKPVRCLDSCSVLRDGAGRVVQYQGALVDITERTEIQKRLHQEQEFVRRLVDSIPDAIVVLDAEGRFTFVSSRAEELSGYRAEELVGQRLGEHADEKDRPELRNFFQKLISGKCASEQLEYRAQRKDGAWRTFRVSAGPLFDTDGTIVGIVASGRDVTESKKVEQQLLQTEKLAAMGQMIAGVAHELNNPLTAILGVTDLLRQRADDETSRRQTDLVHQQARRAANIVQGLLAFARPSAPSHNRIKLEEVVQTALQARQTSLRENGVTVEFLPEPNLPAAQGDPKQLLQVFLALIVNAEQAIREVRDHGSLRVRLARAGDKVVVSFEDDGTGIRADVLPKIFDPFFTTKRPGGGTGLGLTMCLAIAKEHGGTIDVQSDPGAGAVFRVVLPAASSAALAETPAAKRTGTGVSNLLRGHSALVVDDEEGIRELIQVGLSARGLEVECAGSSEEALERLASRSYDAILCDFNLPGLSGEQLFERLRARRDGFKQHFVFMTGDLLDGPAVKTIKQQGAQVVQKPFQISELAALLAETFEPVGTKTS
jgi:PAS domain S-box-containing protein